MAPLFHRRQTSKDEHGHVTTRQHQNVNVDVHNAQEGSQLASVENNVGHFTATDTATIRKYLVLLQDCLAIKFVPLASQQSHPFPFAFNNNNSNNSNNNNGNGQSNGNGGGNSSSRTHNYNGDHQQLLSNHHHHHGSSSHNQNSNHQNQNQKSTTFPLYNFPSTTTTVTAGSRQYQQLQQNHYRAAHAYYESSTAEVDHSLHGLYLYKGFREANLQCFWNAALYETFQNIDYKGYIVPSTILVSALPRFLAILRTAWSRQMLRTPPGYRIEFIGEIEELIADPIQQGQFAPLSDSLCWAILEITSIGQEAFVDSILMALATAFPTMVQPARELVYQTLEKLIRERKVYQTSHGYFVVTPDTFRYMASSNFVDYDPSSSSFFSSNTLTLDALLNPHYESDKLSFSRHSWDSNASADNPILSTGEELADDKPTLKRHNSLKTFRQKDLAKLESSGLWGTRSLSMRLSKSKSKSFTEGEGAEEIKGKSLTMDTIGRKMKSLLSSNELSHEKVNAKNKKNKSFLSKLFPFRRSSSKSRNEKSTPVSSSSPPSSPEASKKKSSTSNNPKVATTSTQTSSSSSVEHLTRLKCSQGALLQERQAAQQQHQHTRFEDDPLACDDTELFSALSSLGACSSNSKWNSLPVTRDRPSSRRSISILDEGPFYDTPNNNTGNGNNNSSQISPNHPAFPGFHRGESSRCSTLSQAASSLGYGSQGQQSLNFSNSFSNSNSQSHSPCPSTSASATYAVINNNRYPSNNNPSVVAPPPPTLQIPGNPHASSYRNSYDFYRRRYPSYNPTNQFQRGSHNYSSLISPITHSNTKPKTHKTTPTYETISSRKSEATANKKENLVDNVSASVINKNPNSSSTTTTTTSTASDPFVTTTTVTQNMKTTTNMELELLLPLGKLMGAALAARRDPKNTSNKVNINLETSGAKIRVGEPKTSTEVKTTINNNGRVETHFECTPGISSDASKSRVEIKTNDPSKTEVIVTQTQPQSQQKSSSSSSEQKNVKMNENSKQGYTSHFGRKSSRGIVKIADIGKDSDEDIKQCVKVKGSA